MRLSELLGHEVVDRDGAGLGHVVDVLAIQDGPVLPGGVDASLRVAGLVVGRDGVGVRLGLHRAGVRGPWPLRVAMGSLDRRSRFVAWEEVRSRADGTIRVAGRADDYPPPPVLR